MTSLETRQSNEEKKDTEGPLRAMSIARFIPRFTKPRLLTSNIPTYRHSFSLPTQEPNEAGESSSDNADKSNTNQPPNKAEVAEEPEQATNASYVEWSKLLPVPSNLLGSFQDLFDSRQRTSRLPSEGSEYAQVSSIGTAPTVSASPPPRLIFFGEQHHQPQVMRAQLQTLHALHQQCQLASDSQAALQAEFRSEQTDTLKAKQSSQASASPIYRLHLILEHFSVLDQDMLNSFSNGKLGPDDLAETYQTQSEEAFHIGHYMPLLMLAKELKVPIWGGFPPRAWARQVFRDGIDAVKPDEEKRVSPTSQKEAPASSNPSSDAGLEPSAQRAAPKSLIQSPLFTSWNAVTKISAAHRSYLSGLMRPDLPPRFPHLPDAAEEASQPSSNKSEQSQNHAIRHSPIYPTWLLKPHNIETKGFGPAQALKDSYLAHVTAWILRGARHDAVDTSGLGDVSDVTSSTITASSDSSQQHLSPLAVEASDAGRPVVNVALVVCGLGHCEYGFGAPERVVQLLSQQGASCSKGLALLPYIIASKPLDSGIWLGYEHPLQSATEGSSIAGADAKTNTWIAEDSTEKPRAIDQKPVTADTVQQWLSDPWGRKMADAVLLYDWVDDEPADEASANADGHQPTPDQPRQNAPSE